MAREEIRAEILRAVEAERIRQEQKFGGQYHSPEGWMSILMEEVGEAARVVNRSLPTEKVEAEGFREEPFEFELIHVAAVAVAIIEHCRRGGLKLDGIL